MCARFSRIRLGNCVIALVCAVLGTGVILTGQQRNERDGDVPRTS